MPGLLLFALLLPASPEDSTAYYYAHQDADALARWCDGRHDRATDLLCRYRLYPLTEDEALLADLPSDLSTGTAREYALLAGLWGYRAARAMPLSALRYGIRSSRLLERARAADAADPYVLLIDGQSLLFKPAIAGGDAAAALQAFEQLAEVLRQTPPCGIPLEEAQAWRWYALARLGDARAEATRQALLARHPPPLFHEFLQMTPR